jgi:tape measure domain-containing protein
MADIATLGLKVDSKGVVVANKELKKLEKQGGKTEKQAKKVTKSFKGLKTAAISLGGALAALGLANLVRNAAKATVALDAIESSLKVATGSAEGAADSIKFLREEAERLGLDLQTSASAFSSFAAAARGTSLEGQAAREVFIGVSEAMTALGRGSVDTERALRAVEQMISKGTVSAEELRQQLGEVLPGAFQLAAKSVGVTTQQLGKMLQRGEVLASDMLPKLARALSDTFGEEAESRARGLQAEMNRFNTAVFDLMTSGNMDGLADAIRDVTGLIKDPAFQKAFGDFVGGLVSIAGAAGKATSAVTDFVTINAEWFAALQAGHIEEAEFFLTSFSNRKIRLGQLKEELGLFKEIKNEAGGVAIAGAGGPLRPKETGKNLPTLTFPSAELLPDASALEAMGKLTR